MKKFFLYAITIVTTVCVKAQDSTITKPLIIPKGYTYPVFRPLSINYDVLGNARVTTKTQTKDVGAGKTSANARMRINANIPVYTKGMFSLSTSLNYSHEDVAVKNIQSIYSTNGNQSFSPDNFSVGLTGLYRSKLFNKPAVYSASILADSRNVTSIQQVRGILSASLVLKATRQTVITAGVAGIIDPSSILPFFPSFTYWHKFGNSNWEVQTILPVKVVFRRSNVMGGWLGIGTEMIGNRFFNQQAGQFNSNYVFSNSELWNGITYEHHISKHLLAGIKAGYKTPINARVTEVGEKTKDYLLQSNFKPAPYVSFNISFLLPRKQ